MKFRLASVAFLLATLAAGISWLSIQPVLVRLFDTVHRLSGEKPSAVLHLQHALPLYLAMDVASVALVAYGALYLTVVRPLETLQRQIGELERLNLNLPVQSESGPLLARVHASLRRAAAALQNEQALTQKQLLDLKANNVRLSEAQTELIAAERLATVGKLAAGVAHEVGNPLSGILGYLSLARARAAKSSPESVEFLDRIDEEVQRIDGIVRGLLDLGRPSKGTATPVDLKRLVDTCLRLLSGGPDFAQMQVEVSLDPNAIVLAESGPLSQVLINLLLNAAQAQNGRGGIRVEGQRSGSEFVMTVSDDGPGIAPDVLEHLFEPFFTTKGAGKGTGLGLSVSRHLVEQMGGRLVAANGEQGGGRFTVALPAG